MRVDTAFQIADLRAALRRRGKLALLVTGAVALVGYWLAMALPNRYESYATVLVEPQAVSKELVRAGVEESNLNERLHLMAAQILARPRLSRLIDELELYPEESKRMLREEVIDLMRERISVNPVLPELERGVRRSRDLNINTFRISFTDEDPRIAMQVAQSLANEFIQDHISERVKISQKSLDFIAAELERISERMRQIEKRVAEVKAENPGSLPEELDSNQMRLSRILDRLVMAQNALDQASSDEAFWRNQAITVGALTHHTDPTSPVNRLHIRELELTEYTARGYTDKHPDVIQARMEIEELRARIAREGGDERDQGLPPTAGEQTAESERRRAALRVEAARQDIERLQEAADELRVRIEATPRVAEQLDALEREYDSQLRSYQTYIERQQQASVQADMERRQLGEQFRVIESAFEAFEPSSPNRPLIVLLGLFFGIGMGCGAAMLVEAADSSVHSPRQLRADLGLPVLATIPEIVLEADRVAQRKAQIRQVLATTAVVAFALLGGAANYVWVNGLPGFLQGASVSVPQSLEPGRKASEPHTGQALGAPFEPRTEP